MKVVINGFVVEGTPEEILYLVSKKQKQSSGEVVRRYRRKKAARDHLILWCQGLHIKGKSTKYIQRELLNHFGVKRSIQCINLWLRKTMTEKVKKNE